ncbi:MAG: UbiA-like polyprenyltransferase [Desulfosalsimonadaceae bacterium]
MAFKKFAELILARQTLFALPFAYIGVLFAGGADPATWIWVSIALAAARTAGMAFNRVIDADIDARNPRTKERLVPRGEFRPETVWALGFACLAVLVLAAWRLNPLCFYLSFPAALMLVFYSYCKRLSAASHFFLGCVEAAAPVGGYLAVTGELSCFPFLLGAIILTWIAGLDIAYALQDADFDRKHGLFSIPAKAGEKKALRISAACYLLCLSGMVGAGIIAGKGAFYFTAVSAIALIFLRQQMLARQKDTWRAMQLFFQINMFVAPLFFLGTLADAFL